MKIIFNTSNKNVNNTKPEKIIKMNTNILTPNKSALNNNLSTFNDV